MPPESKSEPEKEQQDLNEKQKREFLKEIIEKAEKEFKEYKKGYKAFSVIYPGLKFFSIDDKILTNIENHLTEKYNCKLISLSTNTYNDSPKERYIFTFKKRNKTKN